MFVGVAAHMAGALRTISDSALSAWSGSVIRCPGPIPTYYTHLASALKNPAEQSVRLRGWAPPEHGIHLWAARLFVAGVLHHQRVRTRRIRDGYAGYDGPVAVLGKPGDSNISEPKTLRKRFVAALGRWRKRAPGSFMTLSRVLNSSRFSLT